MKRTRISRSILATFFVAALTLTTNLVLDYRRQEREQKKEQEQRAEEARRQKNETQAIALITDANYACSEAYKSGNFAKLDNYYSGSALFKVREEAASRKPGVTCKFVSAQDWKYYPNGNDKATMYVTESWQFSSSGKTYPMPPLLQSYSLAHDDKGRLKIVDEKKPPR